MYPSTPPRSQSPHHRRRPSQCLCFLPHMLAWLAPSVPPPSCQPFPGRPSIATSPHRPIDRLPNTMRYKAHPRTASNTSQHEPQAKGRINSKALYDCEGLCYLQAAALSSVGSGTYNSDISDRPVLLKAPAPIELIDWLGMSKNQHPDPQSEAPSIVRVPSDSLVHVHPPQDLT